MSGLETCTQMPMIRAGANSPPSAVSTQ